MPQTSRQFVGFPAHKITLNTNINITPRISFNPTLIYAGKRYAYATLDNNDLPQSTELDPYALVNLFVNFKDIVPGLTFGAGVYDLLSQKPGFPQAYNGGDGAYVPVPGRSREHVFKLSYQLNFKK